MKLIILCTLFAPIIFLALRQKKWYLYLLFAFIGILPEQFAVELHEKLPLISATRILILLAIGFWCWKCFKKRRIWLPCSILVFLAINLVISLVNLPGNFSEVNRMFLYIFERALLVIAVADLIDSKEELDRCIDFMILGCVAVSVIAVVQTVWDYDIASILHLLKTAGSAKITDRMGLVRAFGTFNAISFGCYCAFMLLPIYLRLEHTKKHYYSFAFALTFAAMICSLTRSAWLCALVVLFILVLLRRKKFFISIYPSILMLLALCTVLCFLQPKLYNALVETGKSTVNAVISIFPKKPTTPPAETTASIPTTESTSPVETTVPDSTTTPTNPVETTVPDSTATPTTEPTIPPETTVPTHTDPAKELAILTQPKSAVVAEDELATVFFVAEGDDLTYQWYYKNADQTEFLPTASFTTAEYAVKMNNKRNGRQVYCVVTDRYGNQLQTDTVTISRESTPLQILQQPTSITVDSGKVASVSINAIGDGMTYRWYFADKGSSEFALSKTITGDIYRMPMTNSRAGRRVYCVVTDNKGNSVQSDTVVLNMSPSSSDNGLFEIDDSFGKNSNNALTSRSMQWSAIEYMAKEGHLLFGYGYNAYLDGRLHYRVLHGNDSKWQKAWALDVGFVAIFTESGLVGFVTLLALLGYLFLVSWRCRSKTSEFDLCKMTMLMIPLYAMLNIASSFPNKSVVWLFFALVYAYQKLENYPCDLCIRLPRQK